MNITKVLIIEGGKEVRAIKTRFAASIEVRDGNTSIASSRHSMIDVRRSRVSISVSQPDKTWTISDNTICARHKDNYITVRINRDQRRSLLNVLDEVINW